MYARGPVRLRKIPSPLGPRYEMLPRMNDNDNPIFPPAGHFVVSSVAQTEAARRTLVDCLAAGAVAETPRGTMVHVTVQVVEYEARRSVGAAVVLGWSPPAGPDRTVVAWATRSTADTEEDAQMYEDHARKCASIVGAALMLPRASVFPADTLRERVDMAVEVTVRDAVEDAEGGRDAN